MRQELLAIVTIHDACPRFSTKIFHFADELEKLKIKYNIALVPFYKEKQDPYGKPKLNIKNLSINWHRFNMLLGSKTKLIRIALHPKDPSKALIDQKNMILKLKEENYTFLQYS